MLFWFRNYYGYRYTPKPCLFIWQIDMWAQDRPMMTFQEDPHRPAATFRSRYVEPLKVCTPRRGTEGARLQEAGTMRHQNRAPNTCHKHEIRTGTALLSEFGNRIPFPTAAIGQRGRATSAKPLSEK